MNGHRSIDDSANSVDSILDWIAEDVKRRLTAGEEVDAASYAQEHPHVDPQRITDTIVAVRAMWAARPDPSSAGEFPGDPQYGQRIGDFLIGEKLAAGGMACVYRAEQVSLGRVVALKFLPHAAFLDEGPRERFRREVQTAARLDHENIIPVYAVGEAHGLDFYAMQLVDGITLASLIDQLRSVPPSPKAPARAEQITRSAAERADRGLDPEIDGQAATGPDQQCGLGASLARQRATDRMAYYASLARLVVQAAQALEYAHENGVVHRDIKPSNILVDDQGHLWITDFGLALVEDTHINTKSGELLGTPRYMSPEQILCKPDLVDYRTDIYSLGTTLYELLVLRPAFQDSDSGALLRQISENEPTPLRRIDRSVPRDLETIVQKAVEKEASHRYGSAQELAADLDRYVHDQPIQAEPATTMHRAIKWSRRNRQWVAGLAIGGVIAVLAIFASLAVAVVLLRQSTRLAERGETLKELQLAISSPHTDGWRDGAHELVGKAAGIRVDDGLQAMAANTLAGMDADLVLDLGYGADHVVFHPDGHSILMGPTIHTRDKTTGPRLCNLSPQAVREFQYFGDGPLGFRPDGTPFQVRHDQESNCLVAINLESGAPSGPAYQVPDGWQLVEEVRPAASAGALRLAALGRSAASEYAVLVWSDDNRERPQQFAMGRARPELLALADNGCLLVASTARGDITVWNLDEELRLLTMRHDGPRIQCLGFWVLRRGFREVGPEARPQSERRTLLAVGDAGGTVTIRDMDKNDICAFCRGNEYGAVALAFSPDGTLLAASCRGPYVRIFRVDEGSEILRLRTVGRVGGLAFSNDGQRLATAAAACAHGESRARVWELINGRGITTLYGLANPVSKVCFSGDGRLLAALSQDWRVGIWNVRTHHLLHVLAAPHGSTADNGALVFSPDGDRFAATAGSAAKVWDTRSGQESVSIVLPHGIADAAAFDTERLLSLRFEKGNDGQRAFQVRDLLSDDATQPLAVIRGFTNPYCAAADPKGRFFFVLGSGGSNDESRARLYDSSGSLIRSFDSTARAFGAVVTDPTGEMVGVRLDDSNVQLTLIDVRLPEAREVGRTPNQTRALAAHATLVATAPNESTGRVTIFRRGKKTGYVRFVELGGWASAYTVQPQFNLTGTHYAYGTVDGRVLVCDLFETRRQLDELGVASGNRQVPPQDF